jgi:hypothetical protein
MMDKAIKSLDTENPNDFLWQNRPEKSILPLAV